jgi:hypothetical protein
MSYRLARIGFLSGSVLMFIPTAHSQDLIARFPGPTSFSNDSLPVYAGDFDGDGVADVAYGSQFADSNGTNSGHVRVFSVVSGALLFSMKGAAALDNFGFCVASLGDLDGDGTPDLAVLAPGSDKGGTNRGAVTVISGATHSVLQEFLGTATMSLRWSVGAGDVDGDGVQDLAMTYSGTGKTRTDVVHPITGAVLRSRTFAQPDWLAEPVIGLGLSSGGDFDADGFPDLSDGWEATGAAVLSGSDLSSIVVTQYASTSGSGNFGRATDLVGDANLDGFADLVVGAPAGQDPAGLGAGFARCFLGPNATQAWTFFGSTSLSQTGLGIADVGDFNQDGYSDVGIGAPTDFTSFYPTGSLTIVSGLDGSVLHKIWGEQGGEQVTARLDGGVDVNGDHYPDVIVGVPGAITSVGFVSGELRVYSGLLTYGKGTPGSGALTPVLSHAGGLPQLGNTTFSIELTHALGGAPGFLCIGTLAAQIPAAGGAFLIDPQGGLVVLPIVTNGSPGATGDGSLSVPAPIPGESAIAGITLRVQAAIFDPAANSGVALTRGLKLFVLP